MKKCQQREVKVKVAQSRPILCDPVDYTIHGILQARILEWVAVPFSRGSSQPRDRTQVSHILRNMIWLSSSLVAQLVKNPPATQKTLVRSLGWEDPLEKGKPTHSSMDYIVHGVTELDRTG